MLNLAAHKVTTKLSRINQCKEETYCTPKSASADLYVLTSVDEIMSS